MLSNLLLGDREFEGNASMAMELSYECNQWNSFSLLTACVKGLFLKWLTIPKELIS